jgi:O-antigen ligase
MNMKTDLSMQGRYIEWEQVMNAVTQMPITGHGFGGRYANFNWFAGYTYITGYTHSGYLGLLFKTGVVGVILMAIPFIGYLVFGLKRLRHKMLTLTERAYLRAGVALMIFIAILGYTGNIFIQREMSVYIALYWCFCVQIDMRLRERQRQGAVKEHT